MFVVGMAGVLVGDGIMFTAGRLYGERVLRFRLVARVMTPERFAATQEKFARYGNWVLFVARFLPGLRFTIKKPSVLAQVLSLKQGKNFAFVKQSNPR